MNNADIKGLLLKKYGADVVKQCAERIDAALIDLQELQYMTDEADIVDAFNDILYPKNENNLAARYIVPPFSVFDTKCGAWQDRKRLWVSKLGNIGETIDGVLAKGMMAAINAGASFFDPVLAEIIITWFSKAGESVLNPFCGEATVGALAAVLKRNFVGVEIRPEQVAKNEKILKANGYTTSRFVCGNSLQINEVLATNGLEKKYDLIFSSPPYYDLEIYSDTKGDISNKQTYKEFITDYEEIFRKACYYLKDNGFVVVKVSEVRNKDTGAYYNFVGDNIRIFTSLGLAYVNEIILLNAIGTACMRASSTFSNRKVARIHQNVLVFYKGAPQSVSKHYPRIIDVFQFTDGQGGLF